MDASSHRHTAFFRHGIIKWETKMWVWGKIRESMESIPVELSRYVGRSEEDLSLSSKPNLHNNVLTPDKIPEFCLPPRLCKRSPLLPAKAASQSVHSQALRSKTPSGMNHGGRNDVVAKSGDLVGAVVKPLPFSAASFGLEGVYESPNTRRKESLFHSKRPTYLFDQSRLATTPRLTRESNQGKNISTFPGFLPLFSWRRPSQTGSTESDISSSGDSTPIRSQYSVKTSVTIPSGSGRLKGATSCPSLIDNREDKMKMGALTTSTSLTLAPPLIFPLDVLQCQERHQREHVLPLEGRGRVRLWAEQTGSSTDAFSPFLTVRVRVVCVEDLRDSSDSRALNCAVSLCLTPGKLQQQQSATIRNCRSPVFNEDFFFTELSREDLLELQLRLKVVAKPAVGTMRRGMVIGIITEPLSHLLPLKNR